MNRLVLPAIALLLAACAPSAPPVANDPAAAPASPPASVEPAAPVDLRAKFIDIPWRVESSNAVAPGTRYRFAADGSLHIDAAGSTPGVGRWTWENGALVMIEEGIAYPTDILRLDATHFSIRSHNPGKPVDIVMVRDNATSQQ
jgi:hypothetical protein